MKYTSVVVKLVQILDHLGPRNNTEGLQGPTPVLKTIKEMMRRQAWHVFVCILKSNNVMFKVHIRSVNPVAQF